MFLVGSQFQRKIARRCGDSTIFQNSLCQRTCRWKCNARQRRPKTQTRYLAESLSNVIIFNHCFLCPAPEAYTLNHLHNGLRKDEIAGPALPTCVILAFPFLIPGRPFLILGRPFLIRGRPFLILGHPFLILGPIRPQDGPKSDPKWSQERPRAFKRRSRRGFGRQMGRSGREATSTPCPGAPHEQQEAARSTSTSGKVTISTFR